LLALSPPLSLYLNHALLVFRTGHIYLVA
jgi:hypothetical protein